MRERPGAAHTTIGTSVALLFALKTQFEGGWLEFPSTFERFYHISAEPPETFGKLCLGTASKSLRKFHWERPFLKM